VSHKVLLQAEKKGLKPLKVQSSVFYTCEQYYHEWGHISTCFGNFKSLTSKKITKKLIKHPDSAHRMHISSFLQGTSMIVDAVEE